MKTERLGLVLNQAEKLAVFRLAEQEGGLSQAALIRRLIRNEATAKGLWPTPNIIKPIAIDKRRKKS